MDNNALQDKLAATVPWQTAYYAVGVAARTYLETLSPGMELTTNQLAEALWPGETVRGVVGVAARQRMFKALGKITDPRHAVPPEIAGCFRLEPGKVLYGNMTMRRLWHHPTETYDPASHAPPEARKLLADVVEARIAALEARIAVLEAKHAL